MPEGCDWIVYHSESLEGDNHEVYDVDDPSERSMPGQSKKTPTPEQQLRQLRRYFVRPVVDSDDLRQPYRNADQTPYPALTETFTTYGAYEDPV